MKLILVSLFFVFASATASAEQKEPGDFITNNIYGTMNSANVCVLFNGKNDITVYCDGHEAFSLVGARRSAEAGQKLNALVFSKAVGILAEHGFTKIASEGLQYDPATRSQVTFFKE